MGKELKGSEELRNKLQRGDIATISKQTGFSWTYVRKVVVGTYPANYEILGMACAMAEENGRRKKRILRHAERIAELARI